MQMDYIYVLICENDWEDTIVFLSEEDAIRESIKNSNYRIEIFSKKMTGPGYIPLSFDDKPSPDKSRTLSVVPTSCVLATYNYYKNGKYITPNR